MDAGTLFNAGFDVWHEETPWQNTQVLHSVSAAKVIYANDASPVALRCWQARLIIR